MALPKWVTPNRQNALVSIFVKSRGFCIFGHPNCAIPAHYYEVYIENLIKDWIADDRAQASALWEAERKALHRTADRQYPLHGQFSGVSKDIFLDNQPIYYLMGLGISGLTFRPFAKVRIASSYVNLYIDLGDTLHKVSKSKRRKAIRYGKPLPQEVERDIAQAIRLAVRHYRS
jgi:hypothetical protein